MVMLVLIRLGDDAYGVPTSKAVYQHTGMGRGFRECLRGALERLEGKGDMYRRSWATRHRNGGGESQAVLQCHTEGTTCRPRNAADIGETCAGASTVDRKELGMKSSEEPKIATWLFESFSGNKELAGDLIEEYRGGRFGRVVLEAGATCRCCGRLRQEILSHKFLGGQGGRYGLDRSLRFALNFRDGTTVRGKFYLD